MEKWMKEHMRIARAEIEKESKERIKSFQGMKGTVPYKSPKGCLTTIYLRPADRLSLEEVRVKTGLSISAIFRYLVRMYAVKVTREDAVPVLLKDRGKRGAAFQ